MKNQITLALVGVLALVCACGGNSTSQNNSTPAPSAVPTLASNPTNAPSTANTAQIPKACALLTTADVEKITGYGGGLADSQDMGETETACTITTPDVKFRVQLTAGPGFMPALPTEKTMDLEGGAKAIVKHSGIGDQGWTSVVQFPNYTVALLIGGTAVTLDVDKKVANVTKADTSTLTYAQVYEALARAIAHNAASGASMPSNVSDVSAKGDPCALLTLDEVKAVMTEFEITAPEAGPSAFGGNICRFRAHSESLKANAIVGVVYFTQAQFEQARARAIAKTFEVNGVEAYDFLGDALVLKKGPSYVRLSIDMFPDSFDTADKIQAGIVKWYPALAQKIAARL